MGRKRGWKQLKPLPPPITISPESTQGKMETANSPSMEKFEDEYYQHLSDASEDESCSIRLTGYEKTLEELKNSKKQSDKDELIKTASNKAEKDKNMDSEDYAMASAEDEIPEGQTKRKKNRRKNFKRRQTARSKKLKEANYAIRMEKEQPEKRKKPEPLHIAQQKLLEAKGVKSTTPPITWEDKVEENKNPAGDWKNCLYSLGSQTSESHIRFNELLILYQIPLYLLENIPHDVQN
ncbi:hypothetical protein JTB14_028655 [Gonioctena quinquepunctata]|nr:hypothetical protein JTB14_028655 [Gonioctena quinquepunctata]